MIERKKKICCGRGKYSGLGCGELNFIFSHGLCERCVPKKRSDGAAGSELKNHKNVSHKTSQKVIRKATGEKVLFDLIFAEREKVSEVSGKPLIMDKSHPMFYWQFSHILPKGLYPKFRHLKMNIKLVLPEEHEHWENRRNLLKGLPEWSWVFDRYEQLKQKYHQDESI